MRTARLGVCWRYFVLAGIVVEGSVLAQTNPWTTNGSMIYYNGGNVGIGTSGPASRFHVVGDQPSEYDGTLTIEGDYSGATSRAGQLLLRSRSDIFKRLYIGIHQAADYAGIEYVHDGVSAGPLVLQAFGGNVGIGTTAPNYKLAVKGTIGAGEVVVTNTSGWADYVFKPDYRLQPLSEVSAYIREHQHLPGIPPAREIKEKGVNLGKIQAQLLAKIEELTLHMIDANDRNAKLEKETRELRDEIRRMKAKLAQ